jgi:hypothetical protein
VAKNIETLLEAAAYFYSSVTSWFVSLLLATSTKRASPITLQNEFPV